MSVAATSKGNPEEDALVEKAIRASVTELQQASREGDSEAALQRAIQASVAEAARCQDGNRHHSEQLQDALYRSVSQRPGFTRRPTEIADLDFDDSGIDTDDDQNIKNALESSKKLHLAQQHDEELDRAIEESRKAHKEYEDELTKQKTEEEIVLEYVKKQSLAEEGFRASIGATAQRSLTEQDDPNDDSKSAG